MFNRKLLMISISALVIFSISYLSYRIWKSTKRMAMQVNSIQKIPSIEFRKIDGSTLVTDKYINAKQLLVLNYFNPDCDHCKSMVREMLKERKKLENVQWLMVTSNTREKAKRFSDSMNLSRLPNVIVLTDTAFLFSKKFGGLTVPSFYVYKKGELLRKHNGECSISYLIQH